MSDSLSRRAPRRFWGWGRSDAELRPQELSNLKFMVEQLGGQYTTPKVPSIEDFALRAPRTSPAPSLAAMFSSTPLDRLNHSYGKSYADLARMWLRDVPNPPDYVVYPDDEKAVIDILDWASHNRVAVTTYGGGSSV